MAPSKAKAKLARPNKHKKFSEVLKNKFLSNLSGNNSTGKSSPKTLIFRGNTINIGALLEGPDSDVNASKVPVPGKKASVDGLKKMPKKAFVKKVIKPRVVTADSDDGFESDNSSKKTFLLPTKKKTSGLKQSSSARKVSVAKSTLNGDGVGNILDDMSSSDEEDEPLDSIGQSPIVWTKMGGKCGPRQSTSKPGMSQTTSKPGRSQTTSKAGTIQSTSKHESKSTLNGDGVGNILDDMSSSDEEDEPLDSIGQSPIVWTKMGGKCGPRQSTSKPGLSQTTSKPGRSQTTSKSGRSHTTSKAGTSQSTSKHRSKSTLNADGVGNIFDDMSSSDEEDESLDSIGQSPIVWTKMGGKCGPRQSTSKPGTSQTTSKAGTSQSTAKPGTSLTTSKPGSKSTLNADGFGNILDDMSSSDEEDEPLDSIGQSPIFWTKMGEKCGPRQSTSKPGTSQTTSSPGPSQSSSRPGPRQSTSKLGSRSKPQTETSSKSTGKLVKVKRINRSTRAGVTFPVGRLRSSKDIRAPE